MGIWGGTFVAGRLVAEEFDPFSAAFCRFIVASISLLLLTRNWRQGNLPRLRLHQVPIVILLGLSGIFAYNVFFFLGLQTTPASRAALIIALNPIFISLSSALLFRESLTLQKLVGILTSLVGVSIVIANGNPIALFSDGFKQGDLFMFGCVCSWGIYTLIGHRAMNELSPLATTVYACLVGTVALFPLALWESSRQEWFLVEPITWLGILYLGILGTAVGFNWYYEGIKVIGLAKAAIFINLVPLFAVIFSAIFLGEKITLALVLGGLLVIVGVYCTNIAKTIG